MKASTNQNTPFPRYLGWTLRECRGGGMRSGRTVRVRVVHGWVFWEGAGFHFQVREFCATVDTQRRALPRGP